jgi:hypothetical protein
MVGLRVHVAVTLRCLVLGHADGAPFSPRPLVLAVQCSECGRVSAGVPIVVGKPRAQVVSFTSRKRQQKGVRHVA